MVAVSLPIAFASESAHISDEGKLCFDVTVSIPTEELLSCLIAYTNNSLQHSTYVPFASNASVNSSYAHSPTSLPVGAIGESQLAQLAQLAQSAQSAQFPQVAVGWEPITDPARQPNYHWVLENDYEERVLDHGNCDWKQTEPLPSLLESLLGDWFIRKEGKSVKITVKDQIGKEYGGTPILEASCEGDASKRIWLLEKDVYLGGNLVLDKEVSSDTCIVWKAPEQAYSQEIWYRASEYGWEPVEDEHAERHSDWENMASPSLMLVPLLGDWYVWKEGKCVNIKVCCQSGQEHTGDQILVASCEGTASQAIRLHEEDVYLEMLVRDKGASSNTRIVWKTIQQGCSHEVWFKDPEECRQEHAATRERALQPLVGRWSAKLMGKEVEILVTSDVDENGEHMLWTDCKTMNVCRAVKVYSQQILLDDKYMLDKKNSKNEYVIWQDITDFTPMETWNRVHEKEAKDPWCEWRLGGGGSLVRN